MRAYIAPLSKPLVAFIALEGLLASVPPLMRLRNIRMNSPVPRPGKYLEVTHLREPLATTGFFARLK